jgi:thiosulfate/3-mercaptopyruvate sulfurtransferase
MLQSLVTTNWLNDTLDHPDLVILYTTLIPKNESISVEVENLQIKGAQFFDLQTIFSDQYSGLPNTFPSEKQFELGCQKLGISNSSKIVVYDSLGIYSSPRVWFLFKSMGHTKVSVLDGGLTAWLASGFETEQKREAKVERSNFSACLTSDLLIDKNQVQKRVDTKDSVILDARSAVRFNGKVLEPRKGLRSGHIPNSFNLHYATLLENGKYKIREELEQLFKPYKNQKELIFSCGSGITACILLLAASEIIPSKLLLYDGSWTEWGSS